MKFTSSLKSLFANAGRAGALAVCAAMAVTACTNVLFVRDDGGVKKIYRMTSTGGNQRSVSPAGAVVYSFPAISPDGQKVAYTDGKKIFTSKLGDIGGASQLELSTQPGRKAFLRWAPSQLVVGYTQFSPSNQGSLWLAATSGVNSLRVTFPTGSDSDGFGFDFYLGPNNVQNIVYSRNGRLYTMYFNGTQPATAITNPGASTRHTLPTVSHDNRLLAYRITTQLTTGTLEAIHLVEIGTWASRHSIVLPSTLIERGTISAIAFSCNDQRLYVAARAAMGTGERREIYSVRLDGSDLQRLTNNTVYDSQPEAEPPPCR